MSKRRKFLQNALVYTAVSVLGSKVVFAKNLPAGMALVGLDSEGQSFPGKNPQMVVLNDRPINMEAPAHLLNEALTPNDFFFVRNNGIPPTDINVANWQLTIEGESAKSKKSYSIHELQSKFETVSYNLTLECGGNGRKEFNPPAKGNQWSTGAVGCAKWTGVRLREVLEDVGIKSNAVYLGYYGADNHLSGDPENCLLYTSPSPRDRQKSRMPSSA